MSLYNDMRPHNLDEIMGQDKIIKILKKDLSGNKIPHAMLFTGTRGVGKTSIARIVARTMNCSNPTPEGNCCNECESCRQILSGNSFDVLELDAASHNSVEDIRELIGRVQYKAIGKYKTFIIDEFHMLSNAAFNCLLKTLEEPPANVLFILCTTEVHKIPATILSRCRKYEFERISRTTIVEKLKKINSIYNLKAEDNALHVVAKLAKGSMRDAESIYEHFLEADGLITTEHVRSLLGVTSEEAVFNILQGLVDNNPSAATITIRETADKGASLAFLIEECFRVMMDIVAFRTSGNAEDIIDTEEYRENIIRFSYEFSNEMCFSFMDALREAYAQKNANLEFAFEAALIGIFHKESTLNSLTERVALLEEQLKQYETTGFVPSQTQAFEPSDVLSDAIETSNSIEDDMLVSEDALCVDGALPADVIYDYDGSVYDEPSVCENVVGHENSHVQANGIFDEDSISLDELMVRMEMLPDEFTETSAATSQSCERVPEHMEPSLESEPISGTTADVDSTMPADTIDDEEDFEDFLSGAEDCARQSGFSFRW